MAERTALTARDEWLPDADGRGRAGLDQVLAHREICRSSPLEVIRDNLSSFFYPARVETLTREADLSSSLLSAVRLHHVTVGFLRFGSEAMVDPGALGAYHVNVPLAGRVASECGDRQTVATVGRGTVFTPRDHSVLPWWSADSSQVCIKISKAAVEAELEALLGHPVPTDIRFDLALDLRTPEAASWLGVVRLLIEEVDRPGGLLERSVTYRDHLEQLLISGLLHVQTHDHVDALRNPQPSARPRTVKRVVDLIEAHPEVNYTLADLARHAGVGARRLQGAFQETFQTSPTGYLRKVKLEHARADLLDSQDTVMAVAYRWGFNHPGRFSTIYRRTYGESPSETARRRD
ncbi:MAG: AraC family transcriptional regulator [Pseudonocardia sp.]|nr:AraC family transcriptional regulator [Pseudonocardia sp.]